MCKAGSATQKTRHITLPLQQLIRPDEIIQPRSSDSDKARKSHLHQQPLPNTISTTISTEESSTSSWAVSSISIEEHKSSDNYSKSNILDDYQVYPVVLGTGHYGCVRECINKRNRHSFAVKSIEKSRTGELDHLRREVSILLLANHPNIMKVVDYYEDSDFVHIVTEKYTGGDLFDKIIENKTENGCFSEKEAARIIKSLLEAVKYLHEKDIVHRDIKPENIMFESKQEGSAVKLIDFGLSRKHRQEEALMRNPVGTAYYMSPEILKRKYDRSCDVWAIGVVAYILLCGYPPFNGVTDSDMFDAILRGHFDFPDQEWNIISNKARLFISCLLRRDPRKRPTAKEALQTPWITQLENEN